MDQWVHNTAFVLLYSYNVRNLIFDTYAVYAMALAYVVMCFCAGHADQGVQACGPQWEDLPALLA